MKADGTYQIGEAAERTRLSLRTIRYYEEMGLAAPSGRTVGGFRLYTEEDIHRLELLRRLKVLDLPLESTKKMLDALDLLRSGPADATHRDALVDLVTAYVEEATGRTASLAARLRAAREALDELLAEVSDQRRLSTSGRS